MTKNTMKQPTYIQTILPLVSKGISIDSRTIKKGQIFFAIKGEELDGHAYVDSALKKGAHYVVVSKKVNVNKQDEKKIIVVKNTTTALQELAQAYRATLTIPIIGVAGSNGKTTTKELLREVLATTYNVHASPSSFNNHIGTPLTILSITKKHDIAVVELGTNHPGELKVVCDIAMPTHGIVTNIGKEHLAGFKTIAGVATEETALYESLIHNHGVLFVPNDNNLKNWRKISPITFGKNDDTVYISKISKYFPAVTCDIFDAGKIVTIKSQLSGSINAENILAAYVFGKYFNVTTANIKKAISNYKPTMLRSMMVKKSGSEYFIDCYNANPSSMELTLGDFAKVTNKHKIAIIGGMREMGAAELGEHKKLLIIIRKGNYKNVYLVGSEFSFAAKKLLKNEIWFSTASELKKYLLEKPIPKGSFVLLKASNGIKLWEVLE